MMNEVDELKKIVLAQENRIQGLLAKLQAMRDEHEATVESWCALSAENSELKRKLELAAYFRYDADEVEKAVDGDE